MSSAQPSTYQHPLGFLFYEGSTVFSFPLWFPPCPFSKCIKSWALFFMWKTPGGLNIALEVVVRALGKKCSNVRLGYKILKTLK